MPEAGGRRQEAGSALPVASVGCSMGYTVRWLKGEVTVPLGYACITAATMLCYVLHHMMQDAGCRMQDAWCRMQDAGCGMQDAGCGMQDH